MLIVMEIFFHSDNAISDIGQDLVCKYDPDIDHFTQAKRYMTFMIATSSKIKIKTGQWT